MVEALNYLVSLFGDFISRLGSLNVFSGVSLLDLITAITVIVILIVLLFKR